MLWPHITLVSHCREVQRPKHEVKVKKEPMDSNIIEGAFTVHIHVEVIKRDSQRVIEPATSFKAVVRPAAFYYGSVQQLQEQIEHLARLKYVYHLEELCNTIFNYKSRLSGLDWVLRHTGVPTIIDPPVTEQLRARIAAELAAEQSPRKAHA